MACCNCCEKTLNLGCINSCDASFNTNILVDALNEGVWVLQLSFGSVFVVNYSTSVVDGESVSFTMTNLNENYTYTGQIIEPKGEIVNIVIDGIEYDCIEFSTKVGLYNNQINL
jgi:hypothetical protein